MATYFINRMVITKDSDNNDEVFVDVQIFDDEAGVINYPKWYQGAMAAAIIADNSVVNTFIQPAIPALVAQKKYEMALALANPIPTPPENP
jgi:uncharacterized iron-regulated protein